MADDSNNEEYCFLARMAAALGAIAGTALSLIYSMMLAGEKFLLQRYYPVGLYERSIADYPLVIGIAGLSCFLIMGAPRAFASYLIAGLVGSIFFWLLFIDITQCGPLLIAGGFGAIAGTMMRESAKLRC